MTDSSGDKAKRPLGRWWPLAFVPMILIGAVPFLDALIIEFSTTKKFPGTQTEFVWSVIAGIVLVGCIAACCISAVGLLQRWESRMGFREGRRARWWLFVLIPLTLLALALLLLVIYFGFGGTTRTTICRRSINHSTWRPVQY
jgi:hypothetical protein